jgi:UDP-N-acetylmuramoylalanine--D-glutamate ligase
MDRYATLSAYAASKARIYANSETAVVNSDDPEVARMPRAGQRVISFSLENASSDFTLSTPTAGGGTWLTRRGSALLPLSALKISGRHNAANALATLALGDALRLPIAPMLEELRDFPGLPHRAQWVAEIGNVKYINDSKGTNVGATLAALNGLAGPLVLIAGGLSKGQDLSPLAAGARGKLRAAVLIGAAAGELEAVLKPVCATVHAKSMDEAVALAAAVAQRGDTVLLSPACASQDMFRDYRDRGEQFARAARELPE